jgi:hypothetical protein
MLRRRSAATIACVGSADTTSVTSYSRTQAWRICERTMASASASGLPLKAASVSSGS